MKNQQIISQNNPCSSNETLLKLQLSEALRLIGHLQRSNGELMKQNAGLLKINSRLFNVTGSRNYNNEHNLLQTDNNSFINDILSLINDNNIYENDKKFHDIDNNPRQNDSYKPVIDNKLKKNENNSPVNDNKSEKIEINGKLYDRKFVIDRLHFSYNILEKQNLSEEELINTYKSNKVVAAKESKKIELKEMQKVPALFFLTHEPFREKGAYEETFAKVLRAYRNLKKRNKKNIPSLARQVKMLLFLYMRKSASPQEAFSACKLTGITGYRYAAKLRNLGLINCFGRGNACRYQITGEGKQFLEQASL